MHRAYGAIGRLLKYNALTAITSILGSVLVTGLLVETFAIPVVIANIISVVVLGGVNFVGADKLVFRSAAVALVLALVGGRVRVGRGEAPAKNGGRVREVRRRR